MLYFVPIRKGMITFPGTSEMGIRGGFSSNLKDFQGASAISEGRQVYGYTSIQGPFFSEKWNTFLAGRRVYGEFSSNLKNFQSASSISVGRQVYT